MNRNLWTWIQLAASLVNAMFVVCSQLANPVADVSAAGLTMSAGQTAHRHERAAAKSVRGIDFPLRFIRKDRGFVRIGPRSSDA